MSRQMGPIDANKAGLWRILVAECYRRDPVMTGGTLTIEQVARLGFFPLSCTTYREVP